MTIHESMSATPYSQFREKYRRKGCIHSDVAGHGAQIWQCSEKATKKNRSIKVVLKDKVSSSKVFQEVSILKECHGHPNLLNVYDVYECDKYYYIVTDDVGHPTIVEALSNNNASMEQVGKVIRQLIAAVLYLHDPHATMKQCQKTIVHGRISTKSVLVPEGLSPTQFVLVDFSQALLVDNKKEDESDDVSIDTESSSSDEELEEEEELDKHTRKKKRRRRKKSQFHPPEYDETGPTTAGDMWAVGVLSFLLLTGHYPFKKPADTKEPIKHWYTITHQPTKDLLEGLLQHDPNQRSTAQQVTEENTDIAADFTGYEDDLKEVMGRLAKINREYAFKKAVRSYIAANLLQESNEERLARIFQLADANNDNNFSREEFENALLEADIDVPPKKLDLYFELLDVDGDKQISYSEFMAFAAKEEILFEKNKLKAAFEAFDWSNTGYITAEDLKHFSASAGGSSAFRGEKALRSKAIKEMIQEVDKNGDGQISFDEFAQMMVSKAYFAVFSW